jgi:hypothetical protein
LNQAERDGEADPARNRMATIGGAITLPPMRSLSDHLASVGGSLHLVACTHQASRRIGSAEVRPSEQARLHLAGAVVAATLASAPSREGGIDLRVRFHVESGSLEAAAVGVRIDLAGWSTANYVLLPAAVYAGNRFPRVPDRAGKALRDYATADHDTITVTPVPRLHPDGEPTRAGPDLGSSCRFPGGPSRIQVLTGDCSTPLVGVQMPGSGLGLIVSTEQRTRLGDSGITVEESDDRGRASILIKAPGVREETLYQGRPSRDAGAVLRAGDAVEVRLVVHVFPAPDVPALFARFFAVRGELRSARSRHDLPFAAAWRIQERKVNRENWVEREGYYSVGMRESPHQDWQTGWVGGPNTAYALIVEGDAITLPRALRAWDFIARAAVTPSGFVKSTYHAGRWWDDPSVCYLRYSADTLYFLIKTFLLLAKRPPHVDLPPAWIALARGLCEGFAGVYAREGRFVHYVDAGTGATVLGGSCAAGLAPAAMALAARWFEEPRYLAVAEGAARVYRDGFVAKGITNGGPGDIHQCIDSESAAALLDSFAVLHEETGAREWLDAGLATAHLCASWTMSYDFAFPARSTFGALDMLTTGTVWANIQNKHSAPGICTLSGDGLLKLFRASGDRRVLDLLVEIAHALPQFLSRADRPIVDTRPGKRWPVMPEGWMNERVNTSDWELRDEPGEEIGVGEIFGGSCWCETSLLLTHAELPGIYLQTDTLLLAVLDHVHCQVALASPDRLVLAISNPTAFDARVKLLAERSTDCARPLGATALSDPPRIAVPAGATVRYEVRR